MTEARGYCLNSQQIREKIRDGGIKTSGTPEEIEKRIQPNSLDVTFSDQMFYIDANAAGIIHPVAGEKVDRALLRTLPPGQRREVNIDNGYELKRDHYYAVRLEEKFFLGWNERLKFSQKSTYGRMFLDTRMMADYNPIFNEAIPEYSQGRSLDLWLLIRPEQFNLIVYPGLSIAHIRTLVGDVRLTPNEIRELCNKNPILYLEDENDPKKLVPTEHIIGEYGLQIGLDAQGKSNSGVVALRAKSNPDPIDCSKKGFYNVDEYFDPIVAKDLLRIKSGTDRLLMSSKEIIDTPEDACIESETHSKKGMHGKWDRAALFDSRFQGNAVFEVSSDEGTNREKILRHGVPVTELALFRCSEKPDKLYGDESLGSSYQGQRGIRVPKQMKKPDWRELTRDYSKLDRLVLVQDAKRLLSHGNIDNGFEFLGIDVMNSIIKDVDEGFFHYRYDCERDELVRQVIPYGVIFGPDGTVFEYERADDIDKYGEERLFGKFSVGAGGHIKKSDGPHNWLYNCLMREIGEEVVISGEPLQIGAVGKVNSNETPVDRVHFGVVYKFVVSGDVRPNHREGSAKTGRLRSIDNVVKDCTEHPERYETWSRLVIPNLRQILAA